MYFWTSKLSVVLAFFILGLIGSQFLLMEFKVPEKKICALSVDDEIFIDNAVKFYVENQHASVFRRGEGGSYEKRPILEYLSVDEFTDLNPKCCSISEALEGWRPDRDGISVYVTIRRPLQRVLSDNSTIEYRVADVTIAMDSCANPVTR